MFGLRFSNICLAIFILLTAGCGVVFNDGSGPAPDEIIDLEDDYEVIERVDQNSRIAIDMSEPSEAGYRIIGAYFDPAMLRLEGYVREEAETPQRVRYIFKVLDIGTTTVLINMEPVTVGPSEIYKRVTLIISDD